MAGNASIPEEPTNQGQRDLAALSMQLVRSDMRWVGRGLLKALRLVWHRRTIRPEHAPPGTPEPTGPFRETRPEQAGDLLIWVPRRINSYLIDDLTGGYGYSHTTVDLGENDMPTGKPVMAEITVGQTVRHKFIDEYGERAYVRVPLRRAGVNVDKLLNCVKSKMGEQYDTWDALTLGEITDPAKEVCSGLVADCMPEDEVRDIAKAKRLGLLHRGSVSVHSKLDAPSVRAFVSPNGFAEYYGAPRGRKITRPDTVAEPKPVDATVGRMAQAAARRHGWKAAAALMAVLVFGWLVIRRRGWRRSRARDCNGRH